MPLRVVRGPTEDLEKLLRRFKRICNREGILRELKQHAFFEKPCDRRRRKQRERIRNIRRAKRRAAAR
jgi:small subunit ribosomal protein S21